MSWEQNRKNWCVTRMSTGFFAIWPGAPMQSDRAEIVGVDWSEAVNKSARLNQVASKFGGQQLEPHTVDEILSAYDVLVEKGDIDPVPLQPGQEHA